MGEDATFEARGLTCLRGRRLVFEDLDFRLAAGEALMLVGPNGSGKSSLLRVLAGLIEPLAGAVAWGGADVREDMEAHRARLAFVGHLDAVKPAFTVRETLASWARLLGSADPVDNALAALGLRSLAAVRGAELSAGQKRRVALARLVVERRALWLLDEPTTGLDAASVAIVERLIETHRMTGGIVVASTHGGLAMPGAQTLDIGDYQAEAA
ncbi:MAG: heme ABC exporter ATP-binding protein CcmA [Marivibrio sp.]|uniref:heme ABC exporter ATP-binding protein CcmA n=1 Tax=Marivibrio sp. TaxID=2039719 RepID=UPI0032EBDE49